MRGSRWGRRALGVTTWSLPVRGAEAVHWAQGNGAQFLHLDRSDATRAGADALKKAAASSGVGLGGLAMRELERCGVGNLPRAREVVNADIDVALDLGVGFVWLPSFNASEICDRDDALRTAELISYALSRSASLVVASENTLDAAGNAELFSVISDQRACLLFDTQNPVIRGLDPVLLATQVAHLVGPYVHLKDGVAGEGDSVLGTGNAAVFATLRALIDGGFSGDYVLENDYREDGARRLIADMAALDDGLMPALP